MMKICLRYVKNNDDAQSLVNQAFLKITENIDRYEAKAPFGLWVRRITINTVIDEFRKNKKHREHLEHTEFETTPNSSEFKTFNDGAQSLDAEALRAMIRMLPETTQQIFNLCVIDGYEYDEVAEMLNITEATCRWHVFNARKVLREMVEKASVTPKTMVS